MKLVIKNMVCDRCKLVVQSILDEQKLCVISVQLGEVDFGNNPPSIDQLDIFNKKINALGFELVSDKKSQMMVSVKKHIVELVTLIQQSEIDEKIKLSHYLSNKLHHDYTYLSNLFSTVEGVTIEQYFINQKIETVKELLIYDEISLTEISYRIGYSSVAHLSRQFKKVTGSTPTQFKKLRDASSRKSIDKV